MNLEFPFAADAASALDEQLAEIDRALDALFLDELEEEVERIRAARDDDGERVVA